MGEERRLKTLDEVFNEGVTVQVGNDEPFVIKTTKKFVVVDPDSGVTVGPFDSKDEATAYFIAMADQEEWRDVQELIMKTGKPFVEQDDPFVFINSRSENLVLVELVEPDDSVRSRITY